MKGDERKLTLVDVVAALLLLSLGGSAAGRGAGRGVLGGLVVAALDLVETFLESVHCDDLRLSEVGECGKEASFIG